MRKVRLFFPSALEDSANPFYPEIIKSTLRGNHIKDSDDFLFSYIDLPEKMKVEYTMEKLIELWQDGGVPMGAVRAVTCPEAWLEVDLTPAFQEYFGAETPNLIMHDVEVGRDPETDDPIIEQRLLPELDDDGVIVNRPMKLKDIAVATVEDGIATIPILYREDTRWFNEPQAAVSLQSARDYMQIWVDQFGTDNMVL